MGEAKIGGSNKQRERRDSGLKGKVVLVVSSAQDMRYELAAILAEEGCRIVLAGSIPQLFQPLHKSNLLCPNPRFSTLHPKSVDFMSVLPSPRKTLRHKLKAAQAADVVREVELDVRGGEGSVNASVGRAWEAFGAVDILLHCSAMPGALQNPLEYTESDWEDTMTVNLKTPWLLTRAVARRMKSSGRGGSVIFVSYISGIDRGLYPGVSVHGAAMAGLHQLTKSLGMELGKFGISVTAVARGLSRADPLLASSSEQVVQEAGKVVPLQRWMKPGSDLKSLVLHLVINAGKYMTASVIIADGGQSIPRARMRSFM